MAHAHASSASVQRRVPLRTAVALEAAPGIALLVVVALGFLPGRLPSGVAIPLGLLALLPGVGWLLAGYENAPLFTLLHGLVRLLLVGLLFVAARELATGIDFEGNVVCSGTTSSELYDACWERFEDQLWWYVGRAAIFGAIPVISAAALFIATRARDCLVD
jgi:hypothetical protein